jgi:hypothetical protein
MAWLILEAAIALAIGLFIVWWTWPRSRPTAADPPPSGAVASDDAQTPPAPPRSPRP